MQLDDLVFSHYLGGGQLKLDYISGSFVVMITPLNGSGDVPLSAGFVTGNETVLTSFYTHTFNNAVARLLLKKKCAVCQSKMCANLTSFFFCHIFKFCNIFEKYSSPCADTSGNYGRLCVACLGRLGRSAPPPQSLHRVKTGRVLKKHKI